MPDAYDQDGGVNQEKRFSVAMQRYRDPAAEEKMNPFTEQEAWEEHQIGKATLKFGSKDKKKKDDDYEFVFEDQIDFIKATVMEGVNVEQETVQSPNDRKTLPIYPYRDQLLQAVNDHQVLYFLAQFYRNSRTKLWRK